MTIIALALAAFLTGARTFAGIAIIAWAGAFGWLDIAGTWLGWLGAPAPAALLTLLAFGELYGDKQPDCPNRTAWYALIGRMVMGAGVGAGIAMGAADPVSGVLGAALGAAGAAAGTFATFHLRQWLIEKAGAIPGALIEDAIIIGGTVLAVLLVR